jgi:hypothetical protein
MTSEQHISKRAAAVDDTANAIFVATGHLPFDVEREHMAHLYDRAAREAMTTGEVRRFLLELEAEHTVDLDAADEFILSKVRALISRFPS